MKHIKLFETFEKRVVAKKINTKPVASVTAKPVSIADIDSNDLEHLSDYDPKNGFSTLNDHLTAEEKARIIEIYNLLKGKIVWGKFFDYKEYDKLERYLAANSKWPFAYNAYPDGDGTAVVFSKVELPKAEGASQGDDGDYDDEGDFDNDGNPVKIR